MAIYQLEERIFFDGAVLADAAILQDNIVDIDCHDVPIDPNNALSETQMEDTAPMTALDGSEQILLANQSMSGGTNYTVVDTAANQPTEIEQLVSNISGENFYNLQDDVTKPPASGILSISDFIKETGTLSESIRNEGSITTDLYFIDYMVEDSENIIGEIPNNALVIELNEGEGIGKISEIINQSKNIDTVHIISQGNSRQIILGDDVIKQDNISEYKVLLSSWEDNLSEDADILFYGCSIAENEIGQSIVNDIAEWTGADIAASTDLTGGADGDWELEYSTGRIESSSVSTDHYDHHLLTYTVTEITDDGTGVINTLSWAINESNESTDVDDDIVFNLSAGSTVTISAALPEVTDSVTIDGNDGGTDVTVQVTTPGSSEFRVFSIDASGETIAIENMIIKGGDISDAGNVVAGHGGSIYLNEGTLNITGSTITGSKANRGGGIRNQSGTLTITDSTINNNTADFHAGGIYNWANALTITNSTISSNTASSGVGGGIYNAGDLTIDTSSIVSENVAESGGGIYNAGDLTINSSSTVSNNIAKKYGGGIYNSSVCTLADSTVSGNSAFAGGGVYNIDSSFTINSSDILNNSVSVFGGGIFNIGTLIVSSSSNISGNTAAEEGGGLLNGVNGTATLTSSTVSSNTSQYGGGIYNDGILTLNSTTVSSNTATIYGNNTINGEDVPLSYLPGNSPDDPFFNELWGMKNVNAPTVWNEYTGSDDIIVAVIDTGVDYTHPDLVDNMWHNTGEIPDNGIDDDNNGYIDDYWGWNFVDDDKDPMDDNGHGTHCAGTIGAVGNNGIGVAGVAWDVQIMALKFIDASGTSTTLEAMIDAVHYAVDMGAKILSCSFGGYDFDASEKAAFEYANANGVLAVVAAGNESNDNDVTPSYPASFDLENIIAIAASGSNLSVNNLASFSNYGATTVDFAAPGVGILSTVPYAVTGKYYDYYDGTSMATPMVSGAAALLWSKFPLLNNAQIKDILMESTESVSDLIGKTVTGGRMNLENAYYRGYRWQGSFNDGTDTTTFTSWRTSIDQGFEDLLEGEGVVFFSKSRFVSTEDISENDFLYNTILSDKNDVINILFHNQGIENGKLILPSVENSGLDNEPAIIPVNEKPDTDTAPNGVYEVASNNDKNNIFFKDSVDASSLRFQEPELPFFVQQNDVLEQQSAYIPNSKESNADFYLSDDINSFLDNFMRDEDDYSMFSDCASNFDKPLPFKSELDLILDRLIG